VFLLVDNKKLQIESDSKTMSVPSAILEENQGCCTDMNQFIGRKDKHTDRGLIVAILETGLQ